MSATTAISWTDATFNPWMGCTKVGPGCDHCYAENLMDTRHHKVQWGVGNPRVRTNEKNWSHPLLWNSRAFFECSKCSWRGEMKFGREYAEPGKRDTFNCTEPRCGGDLHETRRRVFCASLADVFDNEVDQTWRAELFELIAATPNIDWLILTKRIGNAWKMMADAVGVSQVSAKLPLGNVWLGATVVNQDEANRDIQKLLRIPARVRFLSMEPLLGHVDLQQACTNCCPNGDCFRHSSGHRVVVDSENGGALVECACSRLNGLHWVIVGGESGHGARPTSPDWIRSIRDQCKESGTPFHFKQWGEWLPMLGQVQGVPIRSTVTSDDGWVMGLAGKKAAGRLLDGRTHNEFPTM